MSEQRGKTSTLQRGEFDEDERVLFTGATRIPWSTISQLRVCQGFTRTELQARGFPAPAQRFQGEPFWDRRHVIAWLGRQRRHIEDSARTNGVMR